jgi:hypothetical protein
LLPLSIIHVNYSHNNDFFCLPLFFVSSVAIARFVVCP